MIYQTRANLLPPLQSGGFLAATLLLLISAAGSYAQSTDIEFPTPVRDNLINGQIAARDVGDPRLTRHFYALTGTPGDLSITVESKNLNGDVDLFTAGSLRPLAKISLYSEELSTSSSKTIYLRRREPLILRVEARSPNDNEGSYRIRFDGAFEAMSGPAPEKEENVASGEPASSRRDRNVRRVTSVGARIEEPPAESTVKAEAPEATPAAPPVARESPVSTAASGEKPAPPEPTAPESKAATTEPPPRPVRVRRPGTSSRRSRTAPAARRRVPPAEETALPRPDNPDPMANARLIIETRDGMRVERYMNTVRRVTVENGQIVVIARDGKVEKLPMTNVLRMSIEP